MFGLISPWTLQRGHGFETLYIQNDRWLEIITLAKKNKQYYSFMGYRTTDVSVFGFNTGSFKTC